jgi:hypothetical protein
MDIFAIRGEYAGGPETALIVLGHWLTEVLRQLLALVDAVRDQG